MKIINNPSGGIKLECIACGGDIAECEPGDVVSDAFRPAGMYSDRAVNTYYVRADMHDCPKGKEKA